MDFLNTFFSSFISAIILAPPLIDLVQDIALRVKGNTNQ